MNGLTALLKILAVPLLIAALCQVIALLFHPSGLGLRNPTALLMDERTVFEAGARFVVLAISGLLMTVLVALPYFRFSARRGRSGLRTWITGWLLVYTPQVLGSWFQTRSFVQFALSVSMLAATILVVALFWWRAFYAHAQQADAPPDGI